MKWWKKRSMLSQILIMMGLLIFPMLIMAGIYTAEVRQTYHTQILYSIQHTIDIHIGTISERMQATSNYLDNSQYNSYLLRLRNLKPQEEYAMAAALYWQELYREVAVEPTGADVYFFYLPHHSYADVALNDNIQTRRSTLRTFILESKDQLGGQSGWCIADIDEKQWLMLISKLQGIYVGALLELEEVKADIKKDIPLDHIEISIGEHLREERIGYDRLEVPLAKTNLYVTVWVEKEEINHSIPSVMRFLIWAAIAYIICMPILVFALSRILIRPVQTVKGAMRELEEGNVSYRIGITGENKDAVELNQRFNRMADSLMNLRLQVFEKELERVEVEATNLRLQVNPHFILNSLNIIFSLAKSRGENNLETLKSFTKYLANYLRFTLWHTEGKVRLKEELSGVMNYVEIQKVRFPERFLYMYDVPEELENGLIPSLLIMNFVENAIKYALDMEHVVEIFVVAAKEGPKLRITICDTGNGMEEQTLEVLEKGEVLENETGKHIGIWNCRRRMALMYDGDAVLHITSKPGEGTQVFIEIPWEEAE